MQTKELCKTKQAIREDMGLQKKSYTNSVLDDWSVKILKQLEETTLFRQASCVALYHALPGEVQTAAFIEKWYQQKTILLPVVTGDHLHLLPYQGADSLRTGSFGILEPAESEAAVSEKETDLIIVPGIAFDRQMNRLGRGRGFYDRLLNTLTAPKVGICFAFQLLAEVPTESFDQKMNQIITENEVISE